MDIVEYDIAENGLQDLYSMIRSQKSRTDWQILLDSVRLRRSRLRRLGPRGGRGAHWKKASVVKARVTRGAGRWRALVR